MTDPVVEFDLHLRHLAETLVLATDKWIETKDLEAGVSMGVAKIALLRALLGDPDDEPNSYEFASKGQFDRNPEKENARGWPESDRKRFGR